MRVYAAVWTNPSGLSGMLDRAFKDEGELRRSLVEDGYVVLPLRQHDYDYGKSWLDDPDHTFDPNRFDPDFDEGVTIHELEVVG